MFSSCENGILQTTFLISIMANSCLFSRQLGEHMLKHEAVIAVSGCKAESVGEFGPNFRPLLKVFR